MPSEGIEPPLQESESWVLSITLRGRFYLSDFTSIQNMAVLIKLIFSIR